MKDSLWQRFTIRPHKRLAYWRAPFLDAHGGEPLGYLDERPYDVEIELRRNWPIIVILKVRLETGEIVYIAAHDEPASFQILR